MRWPLLVAVLGLIAALVVAGATLAAAAVFSPLRRRVQRWVERRFSSAHCDVDGVVGVLSDGLQSAIDLHRVSDELGIAVGSTLRPAVVSTWSAASGSAP